MTCAHSHHQQQPGTLKWSCHPKVLARMLAVKSKFLGEKKKSNLLLCDIHALTVNNEALKRGHASPNPSVHTLIVK